MVNRDIVETYLKGLLEHLSEDDRVELSYTFGATDRELSRLKHRYPQCPESLLQLLARINGTYWQKYGDHEISVLILGSDVYEYPYYLKSVDQILDGDGLSGSIREIYAKYIDNMPDLIGEH